MSEQKYQVVKQVVLYERDTFHVGQVVTATQIGRSLRTLLDNGALKPVADKKAPVSEKE